MSRKFRFVSLVLALALALSVCSFSAADGYDKVVFAYATFNNIPTNEVRATVEEAVNAITREKIGVEVELMPISIWDYSSTVSRGLQGNDKIDVFQTLGDFNVAVSTGRSISVRSPKSKKNGVKMIALDGIGKQQKQIINRAICLLFLLVNK